MCNDMTTAERLQIESEARMAVNELYRSSAVNQRLPFGPEGPTHEFDIYEKNVVVGGVSTSTYHVGKGSINTGGKDRAASELLWLTLWPGKEQRVHVLTCPRMANWLFQTYAHGKFPHPINIYHYEVSSKVLSKIGCLENT